MRIKRRPVTIKDVAEMSGCSWMTVSNVLNNRPGKVTEVTRERVLKAVRDLNYQPNAIARGLAGKRMNTIGVVLPSATASLLSPYFSLVLGGVVEIAREQRQNIMLFTGDIWMDGEHSLSNYRDGRCDGLLILAPPIGSDIVEALVGVELPFVVLGNRITRPGVSSITIDDVEGGKRAVDYLLDHGHKRIGVLSGNTGGSYIADRLLGYRMALEARGIPFDESLVQTGDDDRAAVAECLNKLLDRPMDLRPTAIFSLQDEMALHALPEMSSRGIEVPNDISVIGFDDVVAAATTVPKLTTIRQPLHEMGRASVEMLLGEIIDHNPDGETRMFPTQLVIRDSVAAMNARVLS